MAMPQPPCRGCVRRRPGCHAPGTCPPWGAYLAAKEAADQAHRARLAEEQMMAAYDKARRSYYPLKKAALGEEENAQSEPSATQEPTKL